MVQKVVRQFLLNRLSDYHLNGLKLASNLKSKTDHTKSAILSQFGQPRSRRNLHGAMYTGYAEQRKPLNAARDLGRIRCQSLPLRLILPSARFNLLAPLTANHHLDGDLFFKKLLHSKAGKSASNSSCCTLASGACLGAVVALTTFCAFFCVALQSSSSSLAFAQPLADDCLLIPRLWAMLFYGIAVHFVLHSGYVLVAFGFAILGSGHFTA